MFGRSLSVALLVFALLVASGVIVANRANADSLCDGQWQVIPSYDVPQGTGQQDLDSLSSVAAVSSTDQWAVGSWAQYPDAYNFHTLVEHWDGSSGGWTDVPSPNPLAIDSYFYGVAADAADDVWAVGGTVVRPGFYHSLVERWDGTSWSIVFPASFPGDLYGVAALGPNDVWAVGTENYPGPGLIEHWDGSSWTATYLRFAATLRSVAAVAPDDIWAVGYQYGSTGLESTLTMHYNGHSWRRVKSPSPLTASDENQNWLTSVTAVAPNDVWAVGWYGGYTADGTRVTPHTLVERWNGARWSVVASPSPAGPPQGDALWGIAAQGPNDVWAVGSVGGVLDDYPWTTPLIAHWNGSAWTQVSAPSSGHLLGVTAEPAGAGVSAVGDVATTYLGTLAEHVCPG